MPAESYFHETPNIILLLFYTVCLLSYTKQRKIILGIFVAHIVLIFLTNGFIFPEGYMPDQYMYFEVAKALRKNFNFVTDNYARMSVGLIFYTVPLMCNSIFSIAGMNYFIYMMIFLFMHKKNLFNSHSLYFFLLYPSLAVYSAVALRDTIVLFFMITSIYYLINNRHMTALIFASSLCILKLQNFLIFLFSVLLWTVMDRGVNLKKIIVIILSIVFLVAFSQYVSIENLNFYRSAFASEDSLDTSNVDMISGTGDLLLKGFLAVFKFLVMPLPWQVRNGMQFIQCLENIGILVLLFYAVQSYIRLGIKDKVIRFLFVHAVIAFAVYGLIISNFGTAARYRYTYITVFFLFFYHRMNQLQNQQPSKQIRTI